MTYISVSQFLGCQSVFEFVRNIVISTASLSKLYESDIKIRNQFCSNESDNTLHGKNL